MQKNEMLFRCQLMLLHFQTHWLHFMFVSCLGYFGRILVYIFCSQQFFNSKFVCATYVLTVLATRIVGAGSFSHVNWSFREIFNRSSKMPFVLAFYTGCLTSVGFWTWLVRGSLIDEDVPCTPCVLLRAYGTMVLSGIGMPILTTPWLVHFMVSFFSEITLCL